MDYSWKRFVYSAWLCMTPFLFPWWGVGIFVVVGILLFPRFFEIIAVGIIMDGAFGFSGDHWYTHILHTMIMILLYGCGFVFHTYFRSTDWLK